MPELITSTTIDLPVSIRKRFADFFQPEEQIAVEWISRDDKCVSIFSGKYEYVTGVTETFVVHGKPGFCAAAIGELSRNGRIIDKRPQNSSVKFWIHLSGRRA